MTEHLRKIKEAAVASPIAEGLQHTEDYKIMINSQLEKPSDKFAVLIKAI